ncbi:MAG: hypothetical protein VR65_00365 [Desulfobulbaceae bacterium BRH_c16a]|nr:MAG: hypothetical protein VR65_00365 [Desulfobulbaceae bacterium BRH_c16a]
MNKQQIFRLIIFPVLLLLWGCMDNALHFQVRYAEVSGLKQDDPVYFEQNKVGQVQKVTYTQQGDYLVDVNISPEFKNAATVDSQFFIDIDPQNQHGKAVTIVQEKPGGGVLTKGAIVQGSVKAGFLDDVLNNIKRNATVAENEMREALQQLEKSLKATSEKLDKEMVDVLNDLSRQFHAFGEEVKKVPDSQEVKQLEQSIKLFADEFNQAQENVRDHIRDEVLPQLRKELDQLRRQLQKEGRDKEIENIDKEVNEMIAI